MKRKKPPAEPPNLSVSRTERLILELLSSGDELYGLEMIAKSPSLKRGTIYVTLDRLEEGGMVTSREVAPPKGARGPSRRMYRISGYGKRALEAQQMMIAAWNQFGMQGAS